MTRQAFVTVRTLVLGGLLLALAAPALAQDLTITNARIIVTPDQIIENGSIVVQGGRITSVAAGAPAQTVGTVVDGTGLTAMAGFIDGHKHIRDSDDFVPQMMSLLEAGYTTILNGGGNPEENLELSNRISGGGVVGPNVIPSGSVSLNQTPQEAAAQVRAMAEMGVFHTGEIGLTPEPAPPQAQISVLRAIVEAANEVGVQVNVHAVSTPATVAAIEAGVTRLVHMPNKDFTGHDEARQIAESGGIVAGLVAFGAPIVGRESPSPAPVQFPGDNTPRFRDGQMWPEALAGANRDAQGRAVGTEGGYTIINARRIWDADPNHNTISFSTDQNYADLVVLEHELKSFSIVFSMRDIFQIMGPNSARFVGLEDEIGTLEPGKRADIILQSGDPTYSIYGMLTTEVTILGGEVVVDKR
jgi:imidazolonepropionase-like amidohydrolase